MKAYIKILEPTCRDPECCGGEDIILGVTLNKELADKWKNASDIKVQEVDLIEV